MSEDRQCPPAALLIDVFIVGARFLSLGCRAHVFHLIAHLPALRGREIGERAAQEWQHFTNVSADSSLSHVSNTRHTSVALEVAASHLPRSSPDAQAAQSAGGLAVTSPVGPCGTVRQSPICRFSSNNRQQQPRINAGERCSEAGIAIGPPLSVQIVSRE